MFTQTPQLVLLRHGQTVWSQNGHYTGLTDLPLTETGMEQAIAIRDDIESVGPNLVVYSSDRKRSRLTAALATRRTPTIDLNLREFDYGQAEGMKSSEIRSLLNNPKWNIYRNGTVGLPVIFDSCRAYTGLSDVHPEHGHGETLIHAYRRANKVLTHAKQLMKQGKSVVLVAHGHILSIILAYALHVNLAGMDYTDAKKWYFMDPAHFTKLTLLPNGNFDLCYRNDFNLGSSSELAQ